MAKRPPKAPPFPYDLLDDVWWSFLDPPFASQEAFVSAVCAYERELREEGDVTWRPDEVVLWAPRVRITCEWWDEPFELEVDLTADGPDGFTAGELLFKIHNYFSPYLSQGDHHFFEGLDLINKGGNANAAPVYEIVTGS